MNNVNILSDEMLLYPGSEWLYFKFYANQAALDQVLLDVVNALYNEPALAPSMPLSLFYVRYFDTDYHLRLRVRVTSAMALGLIMQTVNQVAKANSAVRKVIVDTYVREVERYGTNSILDVEQLFCLDAEVVIGFLKAMQGASTNDVERMHLAIFGIHHYLAAFGYSKEDAMAFVKTAKQSFFQEFEVDSVIKKRLNTKFKELYSPNSENPPLLDGLQPLHHQRMDKCAHMLTLLEPQITKQEFIWSIIHMYINKIFNRNQRFYEMIAYDLAEKLLYRTIASHSLSLSQ